MKIAVYSGSFDPLHIGHLAIMQYLTGSGQFDKVYLVVSPHNPLKDCSQSLSASERFAAAKEAVSKYPSLKVFVDDIEFNLPQPSYTVNTLEALSLREPGNSFTLVIGADNLDSITRWKSYEKMLSDYGVIVYPRDGFDTGEILNRLEKECPDFGKFKITIIDAPLVNVSSTQIRDALSLGSDISSLLM